MKKMLLAIVGVGLLFGGVVGASATVITDVAGIGGYKWLEFSYTLGVSRQAVEVALSDDTSDLFGYRYATRFETELLLDSYYYGDIHDIDDGWRVGSADAVENFLNDFGSTSSYHFTYESMIITNDAGELYTTDSETFNFLYGDVINGESQRGHMSMRYYHDDVVAGWFQKEYGTDSSSDALHSPYTMPIDSSFEWMSSLLVNDEINHYPVPEPSTIFLLGIGLLGLIGIKSRKKKGRRLKMKQLLVLLWVMTSIIVITVPAEALTITNGMITDDFNDGDVEGWWLSSRGEWSIENGRLRQDNRGDHIMGVVSDIELSDQLIEIQVSTSGYAGAVLWYQDSDHYISVSAYPSSAGLYINERYIDTLHYPFRTRHDQWYDLGISANSLTGELSIYVDGAYIFTYNSTTPYRTGLSGVTSGNATGYFDNFRVTSDDIQPIPEPSTIFLLGIGLLGLVGIKSRKKKS